MRSPKSRIQQLKQEIADLEHKLVNSCGSKTELGQSGVCKNPSSPEESRKPTSRNSVPCRTETYIAEPPEPPKKLRILSVKKPLDLKFSKSREKSASKTYTMNKYPPEEPTNFSTSLQKKQGKDEFTIVKSRLQEERLSIIEKEAEKVKKERIELEKEQVKLAEEINIQESLWSMCREDIITRIGKRNEFIGVREELEFLLESCELHFPEDLEFITDELTQHQPAPIVQKPKSHNPSLENSIENNKILLNTLEKKYSRVLADIESLLTNSSNPKLNRDIQNLEKTLDNKTIEYDLDTLENVILDLNALERFDIDEEILRLQLNEVLGRENKLKLEFDYAEREIQEKMRTLTHKKEISLLENELSFIRNQYRNRFAAINHWKEEVETVISKTVSNVHVSVIDRTIIDEFSVAFGKIPSFSAKQQLRTLVDGYLAKVNLRDKAIQGTLNELKKKFVEKNQIATLMHKACIEKNRFQCEKFKLKENCDLPTEKTQRKVDKSENAIKEKVTGIKTKINFVNKTIEKEEKIVEKLSLAMEDFTINSKNLKKKLENLNYSIDKVQANQLALKFG